MTVNLKEISVTVLAKNSQRCLKEVLKSLEAFGEVILYDTGSVDKTIEIAKTFPNVSIIRAAFIGFGPTHNMASAAAKNDWILSIDSDEIVTKELVQELQKATLASDVVYSVPRHNYFNGKFIKWCGWHPEKQYRLYNRKKTRFSDDQVHETILRDGVRHIALQGPIIHYSYHSLSDFLHKMQTYSTLFAEQHCGKKSSSLGKAVAHGMAAFLRSYVVKCGFLGGYEGFVISAYNGHATYYKYLKLREANDQLKKMRQEEPVKNR